MKSACPVDWGYGCIIKDKPAWGFSCRTTVYYTYSIMIMNNDYQLDFSVAAL